MSICFAITDADWALTKDALSMFGTVVSAAGVGLAAWIGFSGLATWRRQNMGVSDHDLSRRLLIDLYRLRDAIGHVRNSVVVLGDGAGEEEDRNLNFFQLSYKMEVRSYDKRFGLIDEIRARLNTSLLESEAVWDGEAKARFRGVFALQHELWMKVRTHLIAANPDGDEDRKRAYRRICDNQRDILHELPMAGEDIFKSDLDAALLHVEEYLRSKLIR